MQVTFLCVNDMLEMADLDVVDGVVVDDVVVVDDDVVDAVVIDVVVVVASGVIFVDADDAVVFLVVEAVVFVVVVDADVDGVGGSDAIKSFAISFEGIFKIFFKNKLVDVVITSLLVYAIIIRCVADYLMMYCPYSSFFFFCQKHFV